MPARLKISSGQYSDKGRKETNQDFHGLRIPEAPQLASKGIALALADGISSSDVSHIASQAAVNGFLEDYYCTPDAWSVKTSAERVLSAVNAWLHSQTRLSQYRYDKDKGYVCTLSAVVFKAATAHVFHVGDARVLRLRDGRLEQLTSDHRVRISESQSYLGRAMGLNPQLEIDYRAEDVAPGDCFVLATDGIHEHVDARFIVDTVGSPGADLDEAAEAIAAEALRQGSADNLTVQIVRIEQVPAPEAADLHRQAYELPFPPILEPRAEIDGYRVVRELHGSSRSHVYLTIDIETGALVVLKTPSIDMQGDPAYVERFLNEEWVARRIDNAHVLKPFVHERKRNFVYVATEYIEGQTLAQWMIDNPKPALQTVRGIVEQVARGLRAFHRLEMVHQDLRPENIMIDATGTVKIIDFGSTRVASIMEDAAAAEREGILGTTQYAAPEYFLGESGSPRSDIFSLGVITYQMLTGTLPYGTQVARSRTRTAQKNLRYRPALDDDLEIPAWIDDVLRKALHPDPARRYGELSEYLFDLHHPNEEFLHKTRPPLVERNPVAFWKGIALVLAVIVLILAIILNG